MDPQPTIDQPRGDFVAFMSRDKQPGDNRPVFDGRLTLPGTEISRSFALWSHDYADPATGEARIMFTGQADAVATSATPMEQVASLQRDTGASAEPAAISKLSLRARQLVLFPNKFKDEAPKVGEEAKNRPDYWGAFNPADGSPVIRISVWMRKDRNGRAMLSGATSYPLPGRTEAQLQADEALLEQQAANGLAAKASGRGRKSRAVEVERT